MTWLRTTGLRILLSLGLGLTLWIFVAFTQNPEQRTTFEKVPVTIEGLGPGLLVVDSDGAPRTSDPQVDVRVEADQETLRTVQQSDFRAFIDASGSGPGEQVLPVKVVPNRPGLTPRVRFTPTQENVTIRLDQEITRTVAIEVRVTGSVPFSFIADQPIVTLLGRPVTEAEVRGPQNRVERIRLLRATADIDRLTADYTSPRTLEALSDTGQVVDDVHIIPPAVDVLIPIRSSAGTKRVPLVPQVGGIPASGLVVTAVSVVPQFVNLTGSSGPLDQVQNATTALVNIAGINRTSEYTVTITPPPGAVLQAGEPTSATVRVEVAAIARPFSITLPVPIAASDIPAGLQFAVSPNTVQLTLTGSAAVLGSLDAATLQGTVSLRDLGPGTYEATPVFNLPAGVSIAGEPPRVTVTLRAPPPTSTPAPTQTAAPTDTVTPSETPPASETPTPSETPTS